MGRAEGRVDAVAPGWRAGSNPTLSAIPNLLQVFNLQQSAFCLVPVLFQLQRRAPIALAGGDTHADSSDGRLSLRCV